MADPAEKVNLVKSLTGKHLETELAQMIVLIDTREPKEGDATRGKPWRFPNDVLFEYQKLDEGDYAIKDFEKTGLVFERKTVPDFYGSVVKNEERFGNELQRLELHDLSFVVVEGDFRDVYRYCVGETEMNWTAFRGMICRLFLNSHTRVIMAGTAANAVDIAYHMMRLYYKDKLKERENARLAIAGMSVV
jgi:ERCC4-type nuclease